MQKRTRSRLVSLLYALVCIPVCAVSFWLFWKDLNSSSVRDDKTKIASITFKHNIAQRKYNDRVVWERLQQNSPLYDMDTIRTANGSQATITFAGGASIEINENTMLQIASAKDGSISISVDGGNITVDTTNMKTQEAQTKAPAISVAMEDGSRFNLDRGSRVSAARDESTGQNNFQLEAGNATVQSSSGTVDHVTTGQSVQVSQSGNIERQPITVTSVSRDLQLLRFDSQEQDEVAISWTTIPELAETPVVVETSRDRNFATIENTYQSTGNGTVNVENSDGRLYWRVYPQNEQASAVEGRITVSNIPAVEGIYPVNNSVYTVRNTTPRINFSWRGNNYADSYRLEIYKSGENSQPVVSETVTQDSLQVAGLEPGNYFWHVVPHYTVNNTGWGNASANKNITVRQAEAPALPVLASPADGSRVNMVNNVTALNLMWRSEVRNADYSLVVSSSRDFSNTVYSASTSSTRHAVNLSKEQLPEGTYWWRILRDSEDDGRTVSSEVRSFTVARYIPGQNRLLYPPSRFSVERSELSSLELQYKIDSEYKTQQYTPLLQISTTENFSRIVTEKALDIDSDSLLLNTPDTALRNGTYFWRVGVKNNETSEKSAWTAGRSFNVLAPMGSPVFRAPVANRTNIIYGTDSIAVKWDAVAGAQYYSVKVFDKNGQAVPQLTQTTRSTAVNVSLKTEQNSSPSAVTVAQQYSVVVQPFADETELSPLRVGAEGRISFAVRGPKNAEAISPAPGGRFNGLEALRHPVELKWKKGDAMAQSQLFVKKRLSDGSWRTVNTINNPEETVRLTRLGSGTYQWGITGKTAGGIPLNSSVREFTVTAVPELQLPAFSAPLSNETIDSYYLKRNRSIRFDWADVPDATDYTFVLYQKNADGSLRKIVEENLTSTEYRVRDLRILDVGNFEWRVTAYAHARDGFEERKSRTAKRSFKIQFELPGRVQTIAPEVQYGE